MNIFYSELTFCRSDKEAYTIRMKAEGTVEIGNDQTNQSVTVAIDVLKEMVSRLDDLYKAPAPYTEETVE